MIFQKKKMPLVIVSGGILRYNQEEVPYPILERCFTNES